MVAPFSSFDINDFSCFSILLESIGSLSVFCCEAVVLSLVDFDRAVFKRFEMAAFTTSSQPLLKKIGN